MNPLTLADLKAILIQVIEYSLNARLEEADITFDSPVHPVHYMERDQLLNFIMTCSNELYGGPFNEHAAEGISITDLDIEQLRKLALWLYDELGGTEAE